MKTKCDAINQNGKPCARNATMIAVKGTRTLCATHTAWFGMGILFRRIIPGDVTHA